MSSVRYEFPKFKLTQQLKEPGGLSVADALDSAEANLDELRPECMTELQTAAGAALTCFQGFPAEFSAEALQQLYAISARAVGIGVVCKVPAADTAFVSLCNLLDHLEVIKRWDREAIAVHVQTLHLLASSAGAKLDEAGMERVLAGLQKVTRRYWQEAAVSQASVA